MSTALHTHFEEELDYIDNDDIRNLVIVYLDEVVPEYFALGVGGLLRHTKAAVKIAQDLLGLEQNVFLSEPYHDDIIAALIIHDTFKQGEGAGYDVFEHPLLAAEKFMHFTCDFCDDYSWSRLSDDIHYIVDMVSSHMGEWCRSTDSDESLPIPKSDAEKFVHMCAYLASRRYISIGVTDTISD